MPEQRFTEETKREMHVLEQRLSDRSLPKVEHDRLQARLDEIRSGVDLRTLNNKLDQILEILRPTTEEKAAKPKKTTKKGDLGDLDSLGD